jgi:hypothetical protein
MCDDDEVPFEEIIAIEQVSGELWSKATGGTEDPDRAQEASLAKPRPDGGHDLAQEGAAIISALDVVERGVSAQARSSNVRSTLPLLYG